jgi:hypothetical protein
VLGRGRSITSTRLTIRAKSRSADGAGRAYINAAIATGVERDGTVVATDITTKVASMIAVAAAMKMVVMIRPKGGGADKPSAATRDAHLRKPPQLAASSRAIRSASAASLERVATERHFLLNAA